LLLVLQFLLKQSSLTELLKQFLAMKYFAGEHKNIKSQVTCDSQLPAFTAMMNSEQNVQVSDTTGDEQNSCSS